MARLGAIRFFICPYRRRAKWGDGDHHFTYDIIERRIENS
jgi:hypothetical protein